MPPPATPRGSPFSIEGAAPVTITPLMPVYPRCEVRPVRGEGVYLYGERGEKYLDFAAGIAVNALGHGHPKLTKAIADQAATLMHVSNLYGSPQGESLAQRIVDISFADTVFFTNSGVEAIECAIKTARRYHDVNGNPERHNLITFKNAFHGRSLGAISATDQPKMRDGFEPLLPGFDYARFNDLAGALALIDAETAGFMVETVQGDGGIPLAMAAGEAVRDVMLEPGFLEHVTAMGDRLRAAFEQLIPNHDGLFEEIRGRGLLLGIKMKDDFVSREFVAHLRDNHGLLTVAAGENVFRVLPPLVIEEEHIAECIERLSEGACSFAGRSDD